MTGSERYISIQHFRTLQVVHAHVMYLLNIFGPPIIVIGEIMIGSLFYSLIKFNSQLHVFLEVAMITVASGLIVAVKQVIDAANALQEAQAQYSKSMLCRRKLSKLEKRYYKAFPILPIRIPNLLTITKRTFVTLVQVVFYNVVSLLVAFH